MNRNRSIAVRGIILLAACVLAGCALGPQPRATPESYDLGPPRAPVTGNPGIPATLLVPEISAPGWLDGNGIVYRLGYENASRPQAYANSQWVSPPAALLTQRLRGRLAGASGGVVTGLDGARADYALRVELEDFSQTFTAPNASSVALRVRASLVRPADRTLVAQRVFQFERLAPSPDARGAVAALAEASDEAVDRLAEWTDERIRARRGK